RTPDERDRHGLAALVRGESRAVLLVGVALNWAGAMKLAREVWPADRSRELASDYRHLKAFTAGTAATFGAFYLYLYLKRQRAVPLLAFGASLKTWAFVLSAILRIQGAAGPTTLRLVRRQQRNRRGSVL